MFAVMAAHKAGGDLRCFSFEPMPAIHRILAANCELHSAGKPGALKAFRCGLSDAEADVEFEFKPNMSLWSTAHADFDKERAQRLVNDIDPAVKAIDNWVIRTLCPRFCMRAVGKLLLGHLQKVEKVPCHLRVISDVIEEEGVERIDLLKVDVEGHELSVLKGMRAEHWPMVRQVTMEVETFKMVAEVRELLEAQGFKVTSVATERERTKGVSSEVSAVYATRP